MADYTLTEIAQAYIHLRPFSVSEASLRALGRSADSIAYEIASEVYGPSVEVEITLEEASLKAWVTVIATSAFARSMGASRIIRASKKASLKCARTRAALARTYAGNFTSAADAPKRQIYRTERRLRVSGRIARVIDRRRRIQGRLSNLSPRQVQRELNNVSRQLESILQDLPPDDAKLLEERVELKGLPPIRTWPERGPKDQVGLPRVALAPRSYAGNLTHYNR